MSQRIEMVEIDRHRIGDTEFLITANKIPSAAVPGTFISNAEYFFVNGTQVDRDEYNRRLLIARAEDDAAKEQP